MSSRFPLTVQMSTYSTTEDLKFPFDINSMDEHGDE